MYLNRSSFVKSKSGKIIDDYVVGKELGKGAYGTVYLSKVKDTGQTRAIKQIKKSSVRNPAAFVNEI
jgi:calcium-dependent protein kinase